MKNQKERLSSEFKSLGTTGYVDSKLLHRLHKCLQLNADGYFL